MRRQENLFEVVGTRSVASSYRLLTTSTRVPFSRNQGVRPVPRLAETVWDGGPADLSELQPILGKLNPASFCVLPSTAVLPLRLLWMALLSKPSVVIRKEW